MILIFGGAYQGKLEYASMRYGLRPEDVCECAENSPPEISKRAFHHFERWVLGCIREEKDAAQELQVLLPGLTDKIILCEDISCGVVPADPVLRAWREAVGRCLALLVENSETVVRVFCGIGTAVKGC